MEDLLKRLGSEVMVADGAMGTLLAGGLRHAGSPPEEILLYDPGKVEEAHRAYAEAGADILTTNTYGAGAMKLREFGLADRQPELVRAAVAAARRGGARHGCHIGGSIGPLGSFLMPFGPVGAREAWSVFADLARLLLEAGVDCISIETMTDIRELRLAAMAVRSLDTRIPLLMHMSFDEGGRTVTGTPPGVLASVAPSFGPGAVGVNCGSTLEASEQAAMDLLRLSPMHVSVQPNAGMPVRQDGGTFWPATPDDFAELSLRLCRAGAAIVGGCCGSTPEHTRAIASAVRGMCVAHGRPGRCCTISSRTTLVEIGSGLTVIGERLNPTGRPRLAGSIRDGSTSILKRIAGRQAEASAAVLDLNVGVGDPALEESFMPSAVRALDNVVTLPFMIDSPLPGVVEAGLWEYPARTFVNSIPCIAGRLERTLPEVRRHGAGFVALLMDEKGIPGDVEGRLRLLERILAAAESTGLDREDILVDPVVLSEGASPGAAAITLETIRQVRDRYGMRTVLGLSNASFGLPARKTVNRAFLSLAAAAGLSAAIMDPADAEGGLLGEASAMLGAGPDAVRRFVEVAARMASPAPSDDPRSDGGPEQTLESCIMSGDPEGAAAAVTGLLASMDAVDLVTTRLEPAVAALGGAYEAGSLFLPGLLAGAEAVRAAFDRLREVAGEGAGRGTILMATVEGDVHDIGKNIVASILAGYGWRIVDLGRNVPAGRIVAETLRTRPDAVGLSALLTPSLPVLEETVAALRAGADPPPHLIIGGAVVTPDLAARLGVLWGRDGVHAAKVLADATSRPGE